MQVLQRFFPNLTPHKFARWSAIVGSVALVMALITYLVQDTLGTLGFGALVIGVVGLGSWILIAPDELRAWLSGRQVYYGTGTIIVIVLVLALVIAGYSYVERQNIVHDLTEFQAFTISDTSVQALRQLELRLEGTGYTAQIVGFYSRQNLGNREASAVLLRQFIEKSNGLLSLNFYDPEIEPFLANQYGYGLASSTGIETGPLYLSIFDPNGTLYTFEDIGDANERSIATAMLRVAVAGEFHVYFLVGHNEYQTNVSSDIGLSGAFNILPRVGILASTLDLTTNDIPADATALIIAGPQSPFRQADVDKIAAYVERGGRLLITGDPPYVDPNIDIITNTAFLENDPLNLYLWSEFGVRFNTDIIVEQGIANENQFFYYMDNVIGSEIIGGLGNTSVFFPLARSLKVVDFPIETLPDYIGNQVLYQRDLLFVSKETAFAETTLQSIDLGNLAQYDEGIDPQGRQIVGVAVRRRSEIDQEVQPRLVILGDTDWLTNAYIQPQDGSNGETGNILLWSSISDWLTQYSEIATIAAVNRPDLLPLVVTDEQQSRIQLITLVIMPGIVLALGVLVWGMRRQH